MLISTTTPVYISHDRFIPNACVFEAYYIGMYTFNH